MPGKKHDSDPDGWARLRFAIIGPLLADPPPPGDLGARLKALAAKDWRHPVTGLPLRFGFATLERWYYLARDAQDPVAALRRRRRRDAGQQRGQRRPVVAGTGAAGQGEAGRAGAAHRDRRRHGAGGEGVAVEHERARRLQHAHHVRPGAGAEGGANCPSAPPERRSGGPGARP